MDLYTVKQAAVRLNCTARNVQKLIQKGLLSVEGEGHNRLITAAALDAYERGTPLETPADSIFEGEEIDFDVAGQLGGLLGQIKLRAEELDFGKLGAGMQEEIIDAGAKFAHALYRGVEAQRRRKLII